MTRRPSKSLLIAAAGVAVLAAVGAGGAALLVGTGSPHAAAQTIRVPKAKVTVMHVTRGKVGWDRPLAVSVRHGSISEVSLETSTGKAVKGETTKSATRWHSIGARLLPSTKYVATITIADEAGHARTVKRKVETKAATSYLTGLMSPSYEVVGIGQPVTIQFSKPVPTNLRAEVEKHLSVTAKPAVTGAWHWFGSETVHWRPESYWKPGTKVSVHEDLSSIYFGHGVWGDAGAHQTAFKIGAALVSKVSVPDHVMKVYDNGKLVRTLPISAGSPEWPTMGGIHVTLAKTPTIIMDSATVGIPKGSPGYYYETVLWDVRISNGGAFVHAAPWSVADQGHTNVSHGCINLSPANAEWFFHFSNTEGDIVDITNPVRGPSSTDAGTEDWNMSWHAWLAGDPLHGADNR